MSGSAMAQLTTHYSQNFEGATLSSTTDGKRGVFNWNIDTGGAVLTTAESTALGLAGVTSLPPTTNTYWAFIVGGTDSQWGRGSKALGTFHSGSVNLSSFTLGAGRTMTVSVDHWGASAGDIASQIMVNGSSIAVGFVSNTSSTNLSGTYVNNTSSDQAINVSFQKAAGATAHDYNVAYDNILITSVPEPTSAVLGAIGALALLRRRR